MEKICTSKKNFYLHHPYLRKKRFDDAISHQPPFSIYLAARFHVSGGIPVGDTHHADVRASRYRPDMIPTSEICKGVMFLHWRWSVMSLPPLTIKKWVFCLLLQVQMICLSFFHLSLTLLDSLHTQLHSHTLKLLHVTLLWLQDAGSWVLYSFIVKTLLLEDLQSLSFHYFPWVLMGVEVILFISITLFITLCIYAT